MTVHDKLRALGEAVTQEKAAEAMGVSPFYFRQILRSHFPVGRYYIENLAKVYPVDVDDFLDETRDFSPPQKKARGKKRTAAKRGNPQRTISGRCKGCDYYGGHYTKTCDFFLLTGKRRGCPPGDKCSRYKPRTHRREPKFIDFGGDIYDV